MGNLGLSELFILLLALGVLPVAAIIIAYCLGKRAGENKILREIKDRR